MKKKIIEWWKKKDNFTKFVTILITGIIVYLGNTMLFHDQSILIKFFLSLFAIILAFIWVPFMMKE